jgi:hypothetical protein
MFADIRLEAAPVSREPSAIPEESRNMTFMCGKSRRVWRLAALVALTLCTAARAELAGDVENFLSDYDRLVVQHTTLAADRQAMADALASDTLLRASVRTFFDDRAEAQAIRLLKALDRRQMRVTLNFKGEKIAHPTKGRGDLTQDATSYITNYDGWKNQQMLVALDIDSMRAALGNSDAAALSTATTQFFTDARLRHQHRLQWQADIRAMKKDLGFKGTGKAQKPEGASLRDFVQDFLDDRAAWEANGVQVEAARNGIRMALSGTGLEDAVTLFLNERREQVVLSKELYLDREAMRKKLHARRFKERRLGQELSAKDLDSDEEDSELEESPDISGER